MKSAYKPFHEQIMIHH